MYAIINGKWSLENGEPLNAVEVHDLSAKINSIKPLTKITNNTDNLLSAFYILVDNTIKSKVINKIINQSDSELTIINQKL